MTDLDAENYVSSKNIVPKLTDQQLRISLSLRLGAKIREKHTCCCSKRVEENGARSAGGVPVPEEREASRGTTQYSQATGAEIHQCSINFGTIRSDLNRRKALKWNYSLLREEGKQLVWNVSCVDFLAPSRIKNGSVANPGTAVEVAEEWKTAKYACLNDKRHKPLAFEIQEGVGPSTSTFLKNLCKNLFVCNQENRAESFFRQRLSLAIQANIAKCSWNGSERRPHRRTLLLVNLRLMSVVFQKEMNVFLAL